MWCLLVWVLMASSTASGSPCSSSVSPRADIARTVPMVRDAMSAPVTISLRAVCLASSGSPLVLQSRRCMPVFLM